MQMMYQCVFINVAVHNVVYMKAVQLCLCVKQILLTHISQIHLMHVVTQTPPPDYVTDSTLEHA